MASRPELPNPFGRYRLLQKLGEGGMGTVYLAEDTERGGQVALKVPHFAADADPKLIDRFRREARLAAAIDHPNVCSVLDVGQVHGTHYLTMPFIDGGPLRITGPRPVGEALFLVRHVAQAVAALHAQGIIHRDLKPANILVRKDGQPVVTDFGLARSLDGTRLTRTGAQVGTPMYMSPEQVNGDKEIGPATDVYSLGVILFELLTGRWPFDGDVQLFLVFKQILMDPAPLPSRLRPGLDPRLDALCLQALAKQPADRPRDMAAFAAALAALEPIAPTVTRPPAGRGDQLACPQCGKLVQLPAAAWHQPLKCPACHSRIPPPANSPTVTVRSPTPPVPPTVPPAAPRPAPRRERRPLLGVRSFLAAAWSIGVLVVVLLGWLLFVRPQRGQRDAALAVATTRSDTTTNVEPKPAPVVPPIPEKPEPVPPPKPMPPPEQKPKPVPPRPMPPPADPQAGDEITNSIGMKLVWVPKGTFQMGSPEMEKYREPDEGPQHEVTLSQGFYMGQYEVTQAEYRRVMEANPSYFTRTSQGKDQITDPDTDRYPVETVSWHDAQAFCQKLSALPEEIKHGRQYRLPTEAQWEYACRGGVTSPFHCGGSLSSDQVNFNAGFPYGNAAKGKFLRRTCSVGSYPANAFGLHDMHGNVYEWCRDMQRTYDEEATTDPVGPLEGNLRTVRGGAWGNCGRDCRAADRYAVEPVLRLNFIGFRVVVAPMAP